jgi:hypothetical protein
MGKLRPGLCGRVRQGEKALGGKVRDDGGAKLSDGEGRHGLAQSI